MQAGEVSLECQNQGAGLEVLGSKWATPPKVIKNNQVGVDPSGSSGTSRFRPIKLLCLIDCNQLVVLEKWNMITVVIVVTIPSDNNISKKEHEKLDKYPGLKEELERIWGIKSVIPVGIEIIRL